MNLSFTVTVPAAAIVNSANLLVTHPTGERSYTIAGYPGQVILRATDPTELLRAADQLETLAGQWQTDLLRASMAPLPEMVTP